MKGFLCFSVGIFLILAVISYAQPFGPPLYIANSETMECKYYFSGDARHFNPRPDNFTINIGYTTDFKSQDQACEFFRCVYTNGTVKVYEDKKPIEKDLCLCHEGSYWNNVTGCVKIYKEEHKEQINIFQKFWRWAKGGVCGN